MKNTEALRQIQRDAKEDPIFLANFVLGYDFVSPHHRELMGLYLTKNQSKALFDLDKEQKDRLILWPRGHHKTTSVVVEAIQLILNYPDIRIALMQSTIKNTYGLLGEIKSHFSGENPKSRLVEFFPDFKLVKPGSKGQFTVPARQRKHLKEATVMAASAKSTKAGQHYDVLFADDLVTEQNFRNPDVLAKVEEDFAHCIPLVDPGGYKIVTGTRYTFGDLYENIIRRNADSESWKISVKDCWTSQGEPLFPQRIALDGRTVGFTKELLRQIEQDFPDTFSAQYLNRPIAAKSHYFPAALIQSRVKPVPVGLSAPIVFIDLASSRRIESDHRIILTGQMDAQGGMYVTDLAGGHYPPGELAKKIIDTCLQSFPLRVLIEKTAPAVYLAELVRIMAQEQGVVVPIDFIEVTNNKDAKYLRIAAVAGYLQRLWFAPGLQNWDRLVEEFDHFPKGSHDDYPDTVGLMVAWMTKNLPLLRPDPMQSGFARSPYTSPSEIHTQLPQSSSEYSLGSDFLQ